MQPYRYHVLVCSQKKPEGIPCCAARGAAGVIDALRQEVAARGLLDSVQITVCGSLGLCERGPVMVVYPGGTWYSGLKPEDIPELVHSHFQRGHVVERLANPDVEAVRLEIESNRERMQAAMRARDEAGVLPDELLQTMRGFQESRVMLTAIELDLFTAIGKSATAGEVARRLGTDERATEMLLNALVAMEMLDKLDGVFRTTPVTARFFAGSSPDSAREAMMHTVHLWTRWSSLTECVRTGTSVDSKEVAARGEAWIRAFIAAMHRNAAERAPQVVRAVGTEGVARVLDVGGGSGAYSIAFARASDSLRVELLDLPEVVPIAKSHIEAAGLAERIGTRVGDLRTDTFGEGYDLVFVSAICHMLSEDENRDLLKRCCKALAPKGRLVIQDFILEPDKTAPRFAALFSLNMLVGTKRGSSYSNQEYAAWLQDAGFSEVRHIRLPGPTGLMIGTV